jgi:pilus assembly protein Flp/PilA
MPALGEHADRAGTFGAEMDARERPRVGSHATGRFAPHPDAPRSALSVFSSDKHGATAIEYALIAASISIVIVTAVAAIGTTLTGFFNSVVAGF